MVNYLTVLVIKPNGECELKDIGKDNKCLEREIGIEEGEVSEARFGSYSIFFPSYINISYCLENGKFPTKLIAVSVNNKDRFGLEERYKTMTELDAFKLLKKINLTKGFIDKRLFPSDSKSLNESIYNYILHDRRLNMSAKVIFSLLLMNNFRLTIKELRSFVKEDQEIIQNSLVELMKKKIIRESIMEDDEVYYYIDSEYVETVSRAYNQFYKEQEFSQAVDPLENSNSSVDADIETKAEREDELLEEAIVLVKEMQTASVSMLQRRFRIGYTRAARLIDQLEQLKIVGPYEGSRPRIVLTGSAEDNV
ncbi:DNA translocase FtsK [Sutcliffiella cohnii]